MKALHTFRNRFFAPPLALAFLFCGLAFADAAPLTNNEDAPTPELILRVPRFVEIPEGVDRSGDVLVKGYTDFMNLCEDFGPYQIQMSDNQIVINSYVERPVIECGQQLVPNNAREYHIGRLQPDRSYQVLFRDRDGRVVPVGEIH